MHKIIRTLLRKLNIVVALMLAVLLTGGLGGAIYVLASSTSSFTQTISAGSLGVDIVDSGYTTVGSPTVAMSNVTFGFNCQTATGTFGASEQQLYITNPDASDAGWNITVAASDPTDVWTSTGTDFDFNDATGSGCTDGADAGDTVGGQMTIDAATNGTLAKGQCVVCSTTDVTLQSSASFDEGATDTITILVGAAGSDDIGDWTVQDIDISQKIPAEQPAASDYDINMVLTINVP